MYARRSLLIEDRLVRPADVAMECVSDYRIPVALVEAKHYSSL